MDSQTDTKSNFNSFNFWTIAVSITAMFITAWGIEKNHTDFEKSLKETQRSVELSEKQYLLSYRQNEDAKKQFDDASKESKEQQRIQQKQFENQLKEWKKQSNASIKQIDYEIKAQRPYIVTKDAGYHRTGLNNTYRLVFCYYNKGVRPAVTLKTRLWIIDSTFTITIHEKKDIVSTSTIIEDEHECDQIDDLDHIIRYVKLSFYYILIEYKDAITKETYFQTFCYKWDRNKGLDIPVNASNLDYIVFGVAKNWEKGKIEDFLISENPNIKKHIIDSKN